MLKFLPLLQLAPKLAQSLTEGDLVQLASAFAPQKEVPSLVNAFMETKTMSGEDAMAHILGTDAVKSLMQGMNEQVEEAEHTVFCRCPNCDFTFETLFNPDPSRVVATQ